MVPEVVAFLVARPGPTPTDNRLKRVSRSTSVARSNRIPRIERARPPWPLRQHSQQPARGSALRGGVDLGYEQVQLTGKGVDLFGEAPVVLEGCVQSPLKCVVLIVRGCQLRGNMVLGTDPGIELVLEVGVPVRQDVPFHVWLPGRDRRW